MIMLKIKIKRYKYVKRSPEHTILSDFDNLLFSCFRMHSTPIKFLYQMKNCILIFKDKLNLYFNKQLKSCFK